MRKLVLIVDDDQLFSGMLKDNLNMIADYSVNIILAYNGKTGIEAIDSNIADLDLVFIDMVLPDSSGIEIYNHTRELSKDLDIVLVSGYPLAELSNDKHLHYLHKGQFGLNELELLFEKIFEGK